MFGMDRRLGVIALAVAFGLTGGVAIAQSPKPAVEKPAADKPAPPAGAPGGPPFKVEMVAATQPWAKVCGNEGVNREVCVTLRDFGENAEQPQLRFALYQVLGTDKKPEEKRVLRLLLPLGMSIKPGFRIYFDGKGDPVEGFYVVCQQNGCFGEAEFNGGTLGSMKKASAIAIQMKNAVGGDLIFNLPTKEFGAKFEGEPDDPKKLEQQLKDKADKIRQQQENAAPPAK